MPRYTTLSMPKPDALALLALARFALKDLEREPTFEERRALESLEHTLEGKDRRATNRHNTAKKPRVGLDLRRTA